MTLLGGVGLVPNPNPKPNLTLTLALTLALALAPTLTLTLTRMRALCSDQEWERLASVVKVQSGQGPSSAPVPPRGTPGGSGQLVTPRKRPAHWAPSHRLGCSS